MFINPNFLLTPETQINDYSGEKPHELPIKCNLNCKLFHTKRQTCM